MSEEQQYITVKQFAERAGVTTQRIYQLLDKSLQPFCKVVNDKKLISIEGLELFRKDDLQENLQGFDKDLTSNYQDFARPEIELLGETIDTLREQLAAKDKQIADLMEALKSSQEQQAALVTALTAAQALHAGTIQGQLTEKTEASDNGSDPLEEEPPPKSSFFGRLFGRKQG